MKNLFIFFLLPLFWTPHINAQRKYESIAQSIGLESIDKFRSFLALPNDASKPEDIFDNISWAKSELEALDFEVKTLETSALPLLLANLTVKKSRPTLTFYMHLDGQAIDQSKWDQTNPYTAVLKEKTENGFQPISWDKLRDNGAADYRIFARSSADDKGPFVMLLTALSYLKKSKKLPAFNLKL
ncbi:MAG: acetylornithine deacetylase, partial [Flavobacteriaceae bacterium]